MNATSETKAAVDGRSTMTEILAKFPGAQRALFRKYHIGGCSSCGFQPHETLADLCVRNGNLSVDQVIAHIEQSHQADLQVLLEPKQLARWRAEGVPIRLLDIRTREEFEAARIEGATLFTQEIMNEMLARWPRADLLVIYDHLGTKSLDAAAYFLGHGFTNVRALHGGVDAWSQEVEPAVRRYKLQVTMTDDFQQKVADAIANPKNMGEMQGADAVGTVGSPNCGDMVRMWIKFKEENGRKVIDRATFQTFGCETAIAVASLATELIRGKTPEEAVALSGDDLASSLGPLPPMKIHCGQLVEGALRNALSPTTTSEAPAKSPQAATLMDSFSTTPKAERKIVFLQPGQQP